jgi:hypothetical protein
MKGKKEKKIYFNSFLTNFQLSICEGELEEFTHFWISGKRPYYLSSSIIECILIHMDPYGSDGIIDHR